MVEGLQYVKVVARHGASGGKSGNRNPDRVQGRSARNPLAREGAYQAAALGEVLVPELAHILGVEEAEVRIARISASPAERARKTGAIMTEAAGLEPPLERDARLHEMSKGKRWLGGQEGRSREKVETPGFKLRQQIHEWDMLYGPRRSGAETPRQAADRMQGWLDDLGFLAPYSAEDAPGQVLVDLAVGHAMVSRFAIGQQLGRPSPWKLDDLKLDNGQAIVLEPQRDGSTQTWRPAGMVKPEYREGPVDPESSPVLAEALGIVAVERDFMAYL